MSAGRAINKLRRWLLGLALLLLAGTAQAGLNGYHDVTDCTTIAGWAWDANRPTTPVSVDIYDGSTLLATAQAGTFRQDLLNAGIGDGNHGFTLATPNSLKDGNAHLISIKYAGIQTILNTSPKTLSCAPPTTVSLTSPAANTTATAPASFTLTASTTGSIAKVEFYNGNTLLGTATAAPYSYTWSNVPAGTYTLTAVATDTQNTSTTSIPVAVTVNTGVAQAYYIHTDHLDTPRVITDSNGNVVWQWDNSDPFGNNVPNQNPSGLGTFEYNQRFAGQYFDKETGLHYNINRDYDPANGGRYLESDPIGLAGGINTYAYVGGNPISKIDPLGLAEICSKFPPFHTPHTFICVDGNCSGKYPSGSMFDSPGEIRDDSSNKPLSSCSNVPKGKCDQKSFDQCVAKRIAQRGSSGDSYNYSINNCGQ